MGFSKVYQAHFMRELLAYVQRKQRHFRDNGHVERLAELERLGSLRNLRNFWDFDGKVTAPLNGFSDAYDYYRRSSSRYYLGENRTPTLIIQSSDDPFVFDHSLPTASELARDTHLELHSRGGHVGFVEGSLRNPGYYPERRIPQWLVQGLDRRRDWPVSRPAFLRWRQSPVATPWPGSLIHSLHDPA